MGQSGDGETSGTMTNALSFSSGWEPPGVDPEVPAGRVILCSTVYKANNGKDPTFPQ